jgi:monoamine oxidase
MHDTRIAIVGGGASGMHAAWLLAQQGFTDWILIERRETLGGRILSVAASADAACEAANRACPSDRFDLGPSWFWPGYQSQLDALVQELGLERFEQHELGDIVVERSAAEAPVRVRGYVSSPASMRLMGGMGSLIEALHRRLDSRRIVTSQAVRRLRHAGARLELDSENPAGRSTTWRAEHVLLAMPPRLVIGSIEFTPSLPPKLSQQWEATATWMAPHSKYFAVYDAPFWREQGLSGEARSALGPLGEIHDACVPGGSAALFGFLAVPAHLRQSVPEEVLRSHCRAQLARLFGPEAATPKAEFLKDWALDPCTATAADQASPGHHPDAPSASVPSGPWSGRLTGIGSEWSRQFPGYVAGAIEAAGLGVQSLSVTT